MSMTYKRSLLEVLESAASFIERGFSVGRALRFTSRALQRSQQHSRTSR